MNQRPRHAFTLVELLVVITIIGMLVALLLPAINAARDTARTASCLNNMRNIGAGVTGYETAKQKYPGYVQAVKRNASQYVAINLTAVPGSAPLTGSAMVQTPNRSESLISWAAVLTPQIERQDLWDAITEPGNTYSNAKSVIKPIAIYQCPSDADLTSLTGAAGLSYVANTGAWDFDTSGAFQTDTKANGLFHNLTEGSTKVLMTDIVDGTSSTIMLSENVQRRTAYCWAGVTNTSGGSNPEICEARFGMVWITAANGNSPVSDLITNNEAELEDPGKINRQAPLDQEVGVGFTELETPAYARPSSNHGGDVMNAVFADGHGQAIAASIDPIVYQQLLAPNNGKCVDPIDHSNLNEPISQYRTAAPLADGSY